MFGWPRKRSLASIVPTATPVGVPSFRPEVAASLSTLSDVERSLQQRRAVVYITVEWSCDERKSRAVFIEFAQRINREHADFGITFWVLSEYTEGIAEWC